ncbi:MAG: hypothetical protein ACI389_02250 [Methanobrevibacter sp.]|uniref:hypothetical protein n=1 Tax=Methanobrevibacter sp. TaxID=66852 RepID=UPI003F0E817B
MVSQHIIDIIIKAEDRATNTTRKVQDSVEKIGPAAKNTFNQSSQATNKFVNSLDKTKKTVDSAKEKIKNIGTGGVQAFNQLSASEKKAIAEFTRFQQNLNSATNHIRQIGTTGQSSFNQLSAAEKKALLSLSEISGKTQSTGTQVSSLSTKIKGALANSWDIVKAKANNAATTVKTKFGSAVDSIKSKVRSLADSFSGMGGMISSAVGALGMAGISDLTIGLAMTREQMTSLTSATMGSANAAKEFVGYLDNMTNNSLVSLNDLGQSMNTIKMATGMSNDQLKSFSTTVNDIGQRAILMGKDSNEAMTLMQAAGSGLNGEFDVLKSNFGVTKEKLEELGWSGAADDVEGYQKALDEYMAKAGDMNGMMDTTTGKLQLVKKEFTAGGRKIGEQFLPYIDKAASGFLELSDKCPWLAQAIIGVSGAFSGFATIAPELAPILNVVDSLSGKFSTLKNKLTGWGGEAGKIATIKEKFNSLKTTITSIPGKLSDIKSKISSIGSGAIDSVKGKFVSLGTSAKNAAVSLATAGKSALTAGADAVKGAAGWVSNKLSMVASTIATGAQTAATTLATAAQTALNFVMSINPIYLVIAAIVALVAVMIYLYNNCEQVRNAINWLWEQLQSLGQWIYGGLVAAWNALIAAMQPVVDFFQSVFGPVISWFMGLLSGNGESPVAALTIGFMNLMTYLGPVGEFIMGVFGPAWQFLMGVIQSVWNCVMVLVVAFQQFMNGQITLPQLLGTIWQTISGLFSSILSLIISIVTSWAASLINKALGAGRGFLNGVISFIRQLPGRVGAYILSTASRIASGAASWISKAKNKAQGVVTGVISSIAQLPGKVYTEFLNIGTRIVQAGTALVNKAKQVASDLINGFLGALGIHSPGIIQNKTVKEFVDMIKGIDDTKNDAVKAADNVATGLLDGFNRQNIGDALSNIINLPTNNLPDIAQPMQTAEVSSEVTPDSELPGQYSKINEEIKPNLDQLVSLNEQSFSQIGLNEQSTLNRMTNHVHTSMINILNSTKNGLMQTTALTTTNLNKMRNSTSKVTKEMVKAWNSMKNSIVSAAKKIKTDSNAHFTQLSSTIGTFYRKLQNPSSWGAGGGSGSPSTTRNIGRPSGGSNKIRNILNPTIPQTISINTIRRNPCFNECVEYIAPKGPDVNTLDLMKTGCVDCVLGITDNGKSAGWMDSVPNNVSYIKQKTRDWTMKGPVIAGKYETGLSFKVSDFENGTPNIGFSSFKNIAESLFSQIDYDFYFDSDKYGSWQNALMNGKTNCSDGSDALIALAHTCGLSAYKQHGSWNGIGHFWAVVEGHKMDTTGFQHGYGWTPSQSAGTGGRADVLTTTLGKISTTLSELSSPETKNIEKEDTTVVDDVVLSGDVNININHNLENIPDGIDEQTLMKLIRETTNDENWIKSLTNNIKFQLADLKAKTRLERKQKRSKGVLS